MDIATLIIAVIGCVTGIASLILNLYQSFSEKPRINIEIPVPDINGFIDTDPLKFSSRKGLVISLRFSNPGIYPISVKQVAISQDDIFTLPNFDMPKGLILQDNTRASFHISFFNTPEKIPFLIEGGNAIDVTFFFPFADRLYKQNASSVNIAIDTINERKNICVDIYELTYENVIKRRSSNNSK